jgi:hypothetical protein
MKCKCGNEIEIKMAAKVKGIGCRILTAITTVVTAECEKCGAVFQVPIQTNNAIIKEE